MLIILLSFYFISEFHHESHNPSSSAPTLLQPHTCRLHRFNFVVLISPDEEDVMVGTKKVPPSSVIIMIIEIHDMKFYPDRDL